MMKVHSGIDNTAIVACCTAQGKGAIALLRICGDNVFSLVDKTVRLASGKKLVHAQTHTIHYGYVLDKEEQHLDQVLFFLMKGPRTFTGQDTIEITCHNNPFIIHALIDRLTACGARIARPGEFTQRAVMNEKMDLLQAEALHELIVAPSRASAQAALRQLEGSLSHVAYAVEQELLTLAVWIEASFEFLDEEQRDIDFRAQVEEKLAHVTQTVQSVLASQSALQILKSGIRIALIGSVNAGKSTLLNALLGTDRAIVSDEAGTTRDTIEAGVQQDGYAWTFIDTAGLRATHNSIEQAGIERSHKEGARADIILLVVDASRAITDDERALYDHVFSLYSEKCILVLTKKELPQQEHAFFDKKSAEKIAVSSLTKDGIAHLQEMIKDRVKHLYEASSTPYVLNVRQHNVLSDIERRLAKIESSFRAQVGYELLAIDVRDALTLLTDLTGKGVSEAVMDKVFSSFCVGK